MKEKALEVVDVCRKHVPEGHEKFPHPFEKQAGELLAQLTKSLAL